MRLIAVSPVFVTLLALAAILTATPAAQASILFGPSVTYTSTKTTDQTGFLGGDSSTSALGADAKLGLLIEGSVFYVGGLYSYESAESDGGAKMTGSAYGPTVGVFSGAFALLGTYVMGGSRTYTTTSGDAKVDDGTGFRIDMSYVAGLTGSLGVGPQITYRTIKYSKSTPVGGTETSNSYQESDISPSLIFWFRF